MPPRLRSRHTFTLGFEDFEAAPGDLQLSEREPYGYRNFADNIEHVITEGDTLHSIASLYFAPIPSPAELWWIIADFQPDPIHDPTLKLTVGATLIVPSVRTVQEEIFGEARRLEAGI